MASAFGVKGLQLFFISPTGERLGILSDSDDSGKALSFKIEVLVNGGVDNFNFNLTRDNPFPISRNTEVFIYVDGVLWFNGYIEDIPDPDQDTPLLNIKGLGFYKRMAKKIVNRSYTSQSLTNILDDLYTNELDADVGINWSLGKLSNIPNLNNIDISFEDISLLAATEELLRIYNYDYSNMKYRFYVDNDKYLIFEDYGNSALRGLFEGFQYQTPEVSVDNTRIINKLFCYRAKSTDKNSLEYVTTVLDQASIDNLGTFDDKLIVPSFTDTTTLTNIANAIIERNKDPQKIIQLNDFMLENILDFGLYSLNNRRLNYWQIINDCDSFTNWSLGGLVTASASLSSLHVLTGRRSIKVDVNNSYEEYLEYTIDEPIFLPKIVRSYVYYDSNPIPIQITYFDSQGNSTQITLGIGEVDLEVDLDASTVESLLADSFGEEVNLTISQASEFIDDQWLVLSQEVGDETNLVDLQVNLDAVTEEDFIVNLDVSTEEQLVAREDVQAALLEVSKVRITILSSEAGTFYIDRLDLYADIYKESKLLLESIEYSLSETQKTAVAHFGEKVESLIDEVKDKVKDGDLALSIFAKQ